MGAFGKASVIRNQIFVGGLYVDGGLKSCWSSVMSLFMLCLVNHPIYQTPQRVQVFHNAIPKGSVSVSFSPSYPPSFLFLSLVTKEF